MKKIFSRYSLVTKSILLIGLFLISLLDFDTEAYNTSVWQDLIINIGSDTSHLNFNWFCEEGVSETPSVKIIGVEDPFKGISGVVDENTRYNKVTVSGLKPDVLYECQVSNDGVHFSDTYTFKTPSLDSFTFAAVGDPQIGASTSLDNDAANWASVINEIMGRGAYFVAGVGDQVDCTNVEKDYNSLMQQYSGFIAGLTQESRLIPFSAAIGNHEGYRASWPGRDMFDYHYNITNKTENVAMYGFNLVNYYYIYNDTLFVVLDTSPYPNPSDSEFCKFLIDAYDKTLFEATTTFENSYKWLIVQTHKSVQCNPDNYFIDDIEAYSRAGFEDLMTKFKVDLVLAGHTHSYIRTFPFKSNATTVGAGGPMVNDGITIDYNDGSDDFLNTEGTIYMVLNSATGSEFYDINPITKPTSKVEIQNYVPQYAIINVSNERLCVNTYELGVVQPVDSFTITKQII